MVRVITQETFNDVVKENIEEFDMSPEEATKEAVEQFEAQGVDLTNIIKDLSIASGEESVITLTINKLKQLDLKQHREEVIKEISVLKNECNKDLAHRVKAGADGAYDVLINLLHTTHTGNMAASNSDNDDLMISVLECLSALMDTQPDLLDKKGMELLKSILNKSQNENVLRETMKWTSVCCIRHETNRQEIFALNICDNCKTILSTSKNVQLIIAVLGVIRKLTLDDDVRHEFGKAHEHAKELGVQLLGILTDLFKENTKPPLVSFLTQTIASLLVRNELCAAAAEGGLGPLLAALTDNYDEATPTLHTVTLVTALAGNDDVKRTLVKRGIVPIIVSLLNRYANNATLSAVILKSISVLCLRESSHGNEFLENGAPEAVVGAMKIHQNNQHVQKNGCWAIRNMVARCRDHNSKFHELGVEAILNRTYEKFHKDFGFDIKSALRDLECDVKLNEQWTGKGGEIEH